MDTFSKKLTLEIPGQKIILSIDIEPSCYQLEMVTESRCTEITQIFSMEEVSRPGENPLSNTRKLGISRDDSTEQPKVVAVLKRSRDCFSRITSTQEYEAKIAPWLNQTVHESLGLPEASKTYT